MLVRDAVGVVARRSTARSESCATIDATPAKKNWGNLRYWSPQLHFWMTWSRFGLVHVGNEVEVERPAPTSLHVNWMSQLAWADYPRSQPDQWPGPLFFTGIGWKSNPISCRQRYDVFP